MVRLVDPMNSLYGEGEPTPEGALASTSTKSSYSRGGVSVRRARQGQGELYGNAGSW